MSFAEVLHSLTHLLNLITPGEGLFLSTSTGDQVDGSVWGSLSSEP